MKHEHPQSISNQLLIAHPARQELIYIQASGSGLVARFETSQHFPILTIIGE